MKKAQIFPSLMSADLLNLESVVKNLEPHCDGFHIDIMDNHFVPNLTWGADLTNQIARTCQKPLLVHLMIEHPEAFIKKLKLTPKSTISFHIESTKSPQIVISEIKRAGYEPSIALKPGTPLAALNPWLQDGIEHALLMSVEPGFSGQTFIPHAKERLKELVAKKPHDSELVICMDGGINQYNIQELHEIGSQQFAVSSALFGTKDPVKALKELYQTAGCIV